MPSPMNELLRNSLIYTNRLCGVGVKAGEEMLVAYSFVNEG